MKRRTIVVAAGAAVALFVLWFLLLWGPQGGQLQDAKDRVEAAEVQNQGLELRLARLQATQERATELMADLAELRRAVPDDPQLAQFILDANKAATDAGVDFLSISPSPPDSSLGVTPSVRLSISVRGDYFAVLDYLDLIEALPRIVVIDSLALTPSEAVEGTGQELAVSISARMFATTADVPALAPDATTTTTVPDGGESQEQVTTSTTGAPQITVTPDG